MFLAKLWVIVYGLQNRTSEQISFHLFPIELFSVIGRIEIIIFSKSKNRDLFPVRGLTVGAAHFYKASEEIDHRMFLGKSLTQNLKLIFEVEVSMYIHKSLISGLPIRECK